MKIPRFAAWVFLSIFSLSGPLCAAPIPEPALRFDNGSGGRYVGGGIPAYSLMQGWEFTVREDIEVSKLGLFDGQFSGGFHDPHRVGLWLVDGTLLAEFEFPAGEAYPLAGSFRYAAIAPIRIAKNARCVIAAFYPVGSQDGAALFSEPELAFHHFTAHSSIEIGVYRSSPAEKFEMPLNRGVPSFWGTFGPSFQLVPALSGATDLSITAAVVDTPSPLLVTEPLTVHWVVSNRGQSAATNVSIVIEPLVSQYSIPKYSIPKGTLKLEGNKLVIAVDRLEPGEVFTLWTQDPSVPPFQLSFKGSVGGSNPDPDLTNNSAALEVPIFSPPIIAIPASGFEGEVVPVRLGLGSDRFVPFKVHYRTVPGTALAGTDFVSEEGVVTFQPSENFKTIPIKTLNRSGIQGDRSFSLQYWFDWELHPAPLNSGSALVVESGWGSLPIYEAFESGGLRSELWRTGGTGGDRPSVVMGSSGEDYRLVLDPAVGGSKGSTRVSASLHFMSNLRSNLMVRFRARDGGGPEGSVDIYNAGVEFSTDGLNFNPVLQIAKWGSSITTSHDYRDYVGYFHPGGAGTSGSSNGYVQLRFYNESWDANFFPPQRILVANRVLIDDVVVSASECEVDAPVIPVQPRLEGRQFVFRVFTCPGKSYRLESRNVLAGDSWTMEQQQMGAGDPIEFKATVDDATRGRFYRVRVDAGSF